MALQSNIKKAQKTSDEISDLLDQLSKLLDRTKVMYEQYFMGIQKMAPAQLHRDIERRIRELTQAQIRNTALRFRFATVSQKFGSYNTYWKRVMRQIERGEYVRDVRRASRRLQRKGEELPDELLVKLPKRMRDRILRDREALEKREARRAEAEGRREPAPAPDAAPGANDRGVFEIGGGDDLDIDAIFAELETKDPLPSVEAAPEPSAAPAPAPTPAPAANTEATTPPRAARPKKPAPRLKPSAAKSGGKFGSRPAIAKLGSRPARPAAVKPARNPAASKPAAANPGASKPAAAKPTAASRPPPGMSENEGRALFEKYAKARRLVGDKRPVTYDQLMKKLGQQTPKIMRDHNASSVDFSVVIKGDKVVLKAKPKG